MLLLLAAPLAARADAVPEARAHFVSGRFRECVAILENIRRAAAGPARVFIMEHVVPGPDVPHFAKLFDIHMMCWGTGQERTEAEYAELLRHAGWRKVASHNAPGNVMSVIEGAYG